MIDPDVLLEQMAFNELIRPTLPETDAEITEFIRDMSLNLYSEVNELMKTTSWKRHRRRRGDQAPNREHRLEELVDLFKFWLTITQGLGYSMEEVRQAFWRKSMVCRQRYSEEWLKQIDRPTVVVDVDNVLCDYTVGFCEWIIHRAPLFAAHAKRIRDNRLVFGQAADFGMTDFEWQGFKHEFRSNGHKRELPLMPYAHGWLKTVRRAGYLIVLLTSRPIDRYPNIFSDTLYWLQQNDMEFDWLWWAMDKKELLVENKILKFIKFAVDDDPRYVEQFRHLGIKTYWMRTTNRPSGHESIVVDGTTVTSVSNLLEIPVIPIR